MELTIKPKTDKLSVLYDGEEAVRELHVSIFGKRPKIQSLEELADLEYRGAKRFALKQLSLRSLLSHSLRDKLIERKVSEEVIDRVVEECRESGYLNDEEWVEGFVRGQKRKGMGPQMIRMKLYGKGVAAKVEMDEEEGIRALLEGKFRNRDLKDYKEKQKVIAAIARRGYSLGAILGVIGN